MRKWLCSCAVAALCAAAFAQERSQTPSFRTGVQLVRIDVSVLDGKRQPVRGLKASDFTVLEDGQPRPIRSFQAVDATSSPPPIAPMAPLASHDVATNQVGSDTSRLIFILMDRSIPTERPMLVARQIADAAVDAMGPGDLAAIVTTGGGVPQNLTSDRARLHKAIASSDWSQRLSQSQKDDPIIAMLDLDNPMTDGRCLCGLCVMDTIARIANDVRDVPRRKVLLFIGSDIIVQVATPTMNTGLSCDKLVRDSREALFAALGTSGLTVHSIDPNGLASVGPGTRATVPNGIENRDGRSLNSQLTQERMDFMAAQGNLAVLPAWTGGRTILNSNEPFRMVPAVLHESDAYYLLAFEPTEGIGDVRHDIQVKVARNDVEVHAARYLAPSTATTARAAATPAAPTSAAPTSAAPAPASPLERALTGLLPESSLPLGMSVATFAGRDRDHAYVGVTLDASAFATAPGTIPLEIGVLASDERGRRIAGARQNGTVQVPPSAGGPGGMSAFVELQTYLTLPPGEYELRAAVMNGGTREVSSVFTHVTVPPFEARVSLSDLVLGTRENADVLPEGAPAIPVVPTTARVFGAGAPAWAFLRVYRAGDGGAAQPVSPVSVDASVLDAQGKRIRHQSLPNADFAGRHADIRLALPIKDLAPGRYALQFDARQGRDTATRAVAFTVAAPQPAIASTEHSPELDAVLAAAAGYVDGYERRISAIGAEEEYEQAAQRIGGGPAAVAPLGRGARITEAPLAVATRKTRAHIMTISLGERGWVSFRDVFESDGHPVRDNTERLSRLLQNVNPDSLAQARQIADESARYNLDPEAMRLDRTINVPMTALHFLRAANQTRSVFRLGRPERVGGIDCVTLQFSEQSRPRLIHTRDDAPAQGTFWIDPAGGGRVLKSELRVASAAATGDVVRSQTTVTYAHIDKLDLWVPVIMDETYDLPASRQTLTGHASYSDFREFKVSTSTDIK